MSDHLKRDLTAPDRLLKTTAAAHYLDVHPVTMMKWRAASEPGKTIGPATMDVQLAWIPDQGNYPGDNIYVSAGTGTWGPPVRFLAPPEVTVFDLYPKRR